MDPVRVVVMGANGVGKSTLVSSFLRSAPPETLGARPYVPTVEDVHATSVALGAGAAAARLGVRLVDTAGLGSMAALRATYLQTGDVYVLAYSVCSLASLLALGPLVEELGAVRKAAGVPPPPGGLVVVGLRADAPDRQVLPAQAARVAAEAGISGVLLEASSTTGLNVDVVFVSAVRAVLDGRRAMGNGGIRSSQRCVLQ